MYVSDCILILLIGYLLGSVPFGVLLSRAFHLPDPRYIGSGNIGATNMLRTGNKKVALLTLLLDAGKGTAAVLITNALFITPAGSIWRHEQIVCAPGATFGCLLLPVAIVAPLALAALAAGIGHMYSPWLKFNGGKGVATLFGAVVAFSWPVGMAAFFIWLIVMFMTRYVSLASITALAAAPLLAWLRVDATSALILGIAAGIAIWKHRENIRRLRQGLEPRLAFGKGR
jgi:glycerol-3-phosphate acyltransferase PlsY